MHKKKPMSTAARKAKGRRLQQYVRDQFRKLLAPFGVDPDHIESTGMGQGGMDVQLSPTARKYLPVAVECKNAEANSLIYNYYSQADKNKGKLEPVVVIKANRKKPLAIVDFEYYLSLEHKRIMDDQRD